jgi:predicted DNA-binding transcriptional regulator AlpA
MSSQNIHFINLQIVIAITGLCRTSVYTIPDFPKPIKIGGYDASTQGGSRWVKEEVVEWMLSRIQARDAMQGGAA